MKDVFACLKNVKRNKFLYAGMSSSFCGIVSLSFGAPYNFFAFFFFMMISQWLNKLYLNALKPNIEFKKEYKTNTVIDLTYQIIKDRNFSITPILADALQDSGFDHEPTLQHLQQGQCYCSDWIFTQILTSGG